MYLETINSDGFRKVLAKLLVLVSLAALIWSLSLNASISRFKLNNKLSYRRNDVDSSSPPLFDPKWQPSFKRRSGGGAAKKDLMYSRINSIRREKIVNMTKAAWTAYKAHAWGTNELKPISKRGSSAGIFGHSPHLGATIVDSLDTLYLMGLSEQFNEASAWVRTSFDIDVNTDMSLFEINIRILGGFLSAFTLTKQRIFLDKAVEVADKMLPSFNTPTGIPTSYFNPQNPNSNRLDYGACSILAEIGSLSLEFIYLTDLTGNLIYEEKVNRIYEALKKAKKTEGLYFDHIRPSTGEWCSNHASMGSLSDSFYEYLFKVWLYTSKRDRSLHSMYMEAMDAVKAKIMKRSRGGLVYTGDYYSGSGLSSHMEHLACFSGGLFALTSMYGFLTRVQRREFEQLAVEITKTCRMSYANMPTGLGPESFALDVENEPQPINPSYLLRPEVIESYFYMWRMTNDDMYREWAWQAAIAIETHCRTQSGGYSGIRNVNWLRQPGYDDVQQSFFLAETLKYLYLIFADDDVLPLDKFVFNTEAHPFRIRD